MKERSHISPLRLPVPALSALLLLSALALPCCVSERVSPCPPPTHSFDLSCAFDTPPGVSAVESIGSLVFYVFDQSTELLVAIVDVPREAISSGHIEVSGLEEGTYTFVAWGTGSPTGTGDFTHAHITDPATGISRPVEVGVTRMEELFVTLAHDPLPPDVPGDVAPRHVEFDDLFFALARDVSITRSGGGHLALEVMRNTSMLDITVVGLDHLPSTRAGSETAAPLDIFVVGRNGRYGSDNTPDTTSPVVRYASSSHTLAADTMHTAIRTLRLDKSCHTGSEAVLLHLGDPLTGGDIIAPLDILGAISEICDTDGTPLYPTQRDIDREDRFDILVEITPGDDNVGLMVRITINGWEVVVLTPITNYEL